MTIRQLYEYIETNLNLVLGVNEVRLYNDDLTKLDGLDIVNTPAVSVEFQTIDYNTEALKQVSGDCFVVLHVFQYYNQLFEIQQTPRA